MPSGTLFIRSEIGRGGTGGDAVGNSPKNRVVVILALFYIREGVVCHIMARVACRSVNESNHLRARAGYSYAEFRAAHAACDSVLNGPENRFIVVLRALDVCKRIV